MNTTKIHFDMFPYLWRRLLTLQCWRLYEEILSTYQRELHLYKDLVRSHMEYANYVWHPYRMAVMKKLEKVQMRANYNKAP